MNHKTKSWKNPYPPICCNCQKEIKPKQKFLKHEGGSILCMKCFKKLKKRGGIK